jgi:hypothetical protein
MRQSGRESLSDPIARSPPILATLIVLEYIPLKIGGDPTITCTGYSIMAAKSPAPQPSRLECGFISLKPIFRKPVN